MKGKVNYEELVNLIGREYPNLSDGFQKIGRYLTQNPNIVALESINTIAAKCAVHPSSLVRFAQSLGYSGFKALQEVFQVRLSTAASGFQERVRALDGELSRNEDLGNVGYLRDLVLRDTAALQTLLDGVTEEGLADAATLLSEAQTIYVAGQLRSEPIAQLLRYLMAMLRRRVVLLDAAGGLAQEMARPMERGDVLVAIAFRHYATEVVTIAGMAAENGTPIIAITDSQLSPLSKNTRVLFTIPEEEYSFSRSLAAPICLVQCLATATAARLQPNLRAPYIPTVTGIAHARKANKGAQAEPVAHELAFSRQRAEKKRSY